MKSESISVGVTSAMIIAADNKSRQVIVHNAGGSKVFLGGAAVTASNGIHLGNGESLSIFVPINETLYGISASGTNDVITLLPDTDS